MLSRASSRFIILLIEQACHTRQLLALKEFKGCAAAGGDVGDLISIAELLNCSRAVAAADDGDCAALCQRLCHSLGAGGKLIELEHAHRSVPDDGARALYGVGEQLDGPRAAVHAHEAVGDVALAEDGLGICGELGCAVVVNGQQELDALGFCLCDHFLCVVDAVCLEQALAYLVALRLLEGVSHAAADDDSVSLLKEVVDDVYLIGDLCAAEDSDEGALGIVKSLAHDGQLLVDEQTRVCRQVSCDACGGSVCSVHGAECIGNKDLCHIGQSLCKLDSKGADTYRETLKNYKAELADLDGEYTEMAENAKVKTVIFGDRFPFRYLVDDYNIDYYAAFVGCSAETEASFDTIVTLANKMDELKLDTIFTIENSDDSIAKSIIENSQNKNRNIESLNSIQSVTADMVSGGTTYISLMKENLETLRKVLD